MKKLLILLAAVLGGTVAAQTPPDDLTTYGETLFSAELNHGAQVAHTALFSGAVTTNSQGQVIACNSLMGSPGKFVINDVATGKKLSQFSLTPNTNGSYATLVASSGDIYLASHPHGHLFRYRPGADSVDDLGQAPGITTIWELEEVGAGRIMLAGYPKARIVEFDPATDKFKDMGPAKEGEDYARAIAWEAETNRLFVGVGSHPALICWDLTTGEKKDILGDNAPGENIVYNVDIVGDKLVTRLSPSKKGLVFDLETLQPYDSVPIMGGSQISPLAPDGQSYYFSNDNDLIKHNLETREHEVVGQLAGNTRAMAFHNIDGKPTLISLAYNGTIDLLNLDDKSMRQVKQDLPKEPVDIHSITLGPDGRIYSSAYVAGDLGIYDPASKTSIQIEDVAQVEGASSAGNVIYFGTYPRARIARYETDPAKHVNVIPGKNPREILRLEHYGQDRPYGMLGIEETGQCVIGTIPDYGRLGGVICVYNEDDQTSRVYTEILGKRAAVTLAHKDGIIYIGTTISGGLGIKPTETEAVIIGMDLKTGEKLFEMVPVPGMRIVSDLDIMPDGNLWGWAEGTVFVFDPATRKVTKSKTVKALPRHSGHMWRGAMFTSPKSDGKVFCICYGQVIELNMPEFSVEKVAAAKGFSTLIYHEKTGSLFFGRDHELIEWTAKK